MRILLINPPSKPITRDMAGGLGFDGGSTVILPPLDLLWLATVLQKQDHKVKIIDSNPEKLSDKRIFQIIRNFKPTQFIILVSLPTLESDCSFVKEIKNLFPQKKLFAKFNLPEDRLIKEILKRSRADFCLFGQNELLIEKNMKGILKAGLAWLNKKNQFEKIESLPIINLDRLPIPERKLIKNKLYRYYLLGKNPVTTMQSSRGCPMPCSFYCPYPLVQGKKWLARSPKHVVKEIKDIIKNHKIKDILFRDATFTLNKKRVTKICQLIKKNKLKFSWWCETRTNFLDEKLLKTMKEAGLKGMNIGVETGDPKLLKREAKPGTSLKQLKRVKKWSDGLKIELHFLLMIGFPNETKKTIYKTYQLVKKLKPSSFGLTIATPYPGTLLYKLAKKNNWIKKFDWQYYGGHFPVMNTKNLTVDDLKNAQSYITRCLWLPRQKDLISKGKLALLEKRFKKWQKS